MYSLLYLSPFLPPPLVSVCFVFPFSSRLATPTVPLPVLPPLVIFSTGGGEGGRGGRGGGGGMDGRSEINPFPVWSLSPPHDESVAYLLIILVLLSSLYIYFFLFILLLWFAGIVLTWFHKVLPFNKSQQFIQWPIISNRGCGRHWGCLDNGRWGLMVPDTWLVGWWVSVSVSVRVWVVRVTMRWHRICVTMGTLMNMLMR